MQGRHNKKSLLGFTIIELLLVISIIGILATVVLVNYSSIKAKSRDARRMADLKELSKAIELYYEVNKKYPDASGNSTDKPAWSGECGSYKQGSDPSIWIKNLAPNYLPNLPKDPKYKPESYANNDTAAQCYLYRTNGKDYMALSHNTMESVVDDGAANSFPPGCAPSEEDPSAKDPGDQNNDPNFQVMDRKCHEQPTIAVYSPGGWNW